MKNAKANKGMDAWKQSFVSKLDDARSHWSQHFDNLLESVVAPAFDEFGVFLQNHEFSSSQPMKEPGRRSFKFELSENTYVLLMFRSTGLGSFELRSECFVPGRDSQNDQSDHRVSDLDDGWARGQFQAALDAFVELLSGSQEQSCEESESFEELLAV